MGFFVRLAISATLLAAVFYNVDTNDLTSAADSLEPETIFLAGLGFSLLGTIQALRWQTIIRAIGEYFDYLTALRCVLIGIFFNQMLPSSIGGDAMRIWEGRKNGLSLGCAINSVICDRLVALVALFVIVALTAGTLIKILPGQNATAGISVMCILVISGLIFLMSADKFSKRLPGWRIIVGIQKLSRDARTVFLSFRVHTVTIVLAIIIHIGVITIAIQVAWSMDVSISFLDALGLLPFVFLVSTLPISVSGWGTREAAMVAALGLVGIAPGQALALSVGVGFSMTISGVPGGIIWLVNRKTKSI